MRYVTIIEAYFNPSFSLGNTIVLVGCALPHQLLCVHRAQCTSLLAEIGNLIHFSIANIHSVSYSTLAVFEIRDKSPWKTHR